MTTLNIPMTRLTQRIHVRYQDWPARQLWLVIFCPELGIRRWIIGPPKGSRKMNRRQR